MLIKKIVITKYNKAEKMYNTLTNRICGKNWM